ncbi:hypothetical protein RRG08_054676 [Elysia crispata]|uniref:G-protein coupled receptors family 1 profile domain-containing protein n=1 Tax=Elysia crispata TaxID=231223 RepID=A0AAE1B332_9GAST|nr:hypothetical protein RRG08_054676 [Elysia crispata]
MFATLTKKHDRRLSDLFYNLAWFSERILAGAELVHNQHPYHSLLWTGFFISRCSQMWYVISVLLTVFAAVQKCSCIALPLVFGHFFTQRRTVAVVITIFIVTITYHIPGLSLYRWEEFFDHRRNRTRLGYGWINRPLGLKLNITTDWINFIFVPFTSEGVIIVCVIIMTMKLRQAAATRLAMTAGSSATHGGGKKSTGTHLVIPNSQNQRVHTSFLSEITPEQILESQVTRDKVVKNSNDILNPRELRVIRSANLICVIFIVGTLPYLVITACNIAFRPVFSDIGEIELYFTVRGLQDIIYVSSTAANILVYYKFNTKYRKAINSMFLCWCTELYHNDDS